MRDRATLLVTAAVIYLPLLLTAPGRVGADTKTYLYLDPGRLLADAPYIWHDRIGLGTVTHQNIGYLFPLGPFYWLFDLVGAPDWLAQRIWLGSVLFAAALGVRYLIRTVGWSGSRRTPVLVAMLAYALSPYFLAYAARISVILLPFAALPWLIALTARSVRGGGWRYPAWFAFTVLVVGGINATALILVGLGPALWLVYAVVIERDATVRQAAAAVARIGVLTLGTSVWWMAGLTIQGRHGLPVIRYTETYRTVTETATAPEVLRGLGYWFFYGSDKLGPWIEPSVTYTTNLGALALSFAIPIVALVSLAVVRWRHRGFAAILILLGGLVAVGGHPWDAGSPLGSLFTGFTRSDAGLALRSTPRAVPLVALGMALLLGAGCAAVASALEARRPRLAGTIPVVVAIAVVANMSPLWTGALVSDNLQRSEELPDYWVEAIAAVDAGDHDYRVLELPGTEFAAYRWGNTVDPITPGLTDRPWVARELFQYGSAQSANLLNAFDRRLHEDTLDPEAIAPIARLLGVDTLLVRSDLQYERYRIARPRLVWDQLSRAPGLGTPIPFGPTDRNAADPSQPLIDEIELALDPRLVDPPAVALIAVEDPVPIVRSLTARHPMVLSGDGEGVVDAASAGLLSPTQVLLQSAWFAAEATDPAILERALGEDADLVVTDTNRRRAARWGTLRETNGYTELEDEVPLGYDPTDQRLDVFPGSNDDTRTVTVVRPRDGLVVATARASAWGNPITLTPDDRPMVALDGDPTTAWRVGAIDDPRGERLVIDLGDPVTTDAIALLQPTTLTRNRWITSVRLTQSVPGASGGFDQVASSVVDLDDLSRDPTAGDPAVGPGQVVPVAPVPFTRLEIEILDTNVAPRPRYDGLSGVGFAEVGIPGVGTIETVRPPVDLLRRVGASSIDHRLVYVFSRLRSNPAEPVRGDPETTLRRIIEVPAARSFNVEGTARISAFLTDEAIDELIGLPGAAAGGVTVRSSERLPGSLVHRASAALDGDLATFWSSPFAQDGEVWLDVTSAAPFTVDRLDLSVVADGRHSVPTRVRIEADEDGVRRVVATVDLPDIADDPDRPNATVPVTVPLPSPITTRGLRLVVEEVRPVTTKDWYSNLPVVMPVAIAELGLGPLMVATPPPEIATGCREDLVTIDGRPVPVALSGTTADALARRSLAVQACTPVDLTTGEHLLEASDGRQSGFDIDRLTLGSAAGGAPLDEADLPRRLPGGPTVEVTGTGRVDVQADAGAAPDPWWLVLGQSWSDGWQAELGGADLGRPVLVDGFANGWPVDAPSAAGALRIDWVPQRLVWAALGVSAVATALVLVLALVGKRRPRRRPERADPVFTDRPVLDVRPSAPSPGTTSLSTSVAVGAGVALIAALNLPAGTLWLAPFIGLLAGVSLRSWRWSPLPALVAVATFGASAAFTVAQQYRKGYPADFDWPAAFGRVHILGVVALLCIGTAGVVDIVRRFRTSGDLRPSTDPPPSTSPSPPIS